MTDGLKAYRCVSTDPAWKGKKLTHNWVSHGKYQFTKLVEVNDGVLQAGTQLQDGLWGHLKDALRAKRGVYHEHLGEDVRVFQWFFVRGDVDPLVAFDNGVQECVSRILLKL